MANGQKIRGKGGILELTSADGLIVEELACMTSWTLDTSSNVFTDDSTCMISNGDGGADGNVSWDTVELNSKAFSLSAEQFFQEAIDAGAAALVDITNVGAKMTFKLYPNTKEVGKVVYSGAVLLETGSVPSETTSNITQSISFKGDGALTRDLVV